MELLHLIQHLLNLRGDWHSVRDVIALIPFALQTGRVARDSDFAIANPIPVQPGKRTGMKEGQKNQLRCCNCVGV